MAVASGSEATAGVAVPGQREQGQLPGGAGPEPTVTVRAAEGGQFIVGFMGRYEDELVKRDGRWYIQSRKLVSFVQ